MWPIHFAILLAYLVPGFYLPGTIDVSICKQWKAIKPILVFTLLMTVSMLVNPYGLDGVLYIVKSFQADTFLYVNILEVRPPMFVSSCGLIIILGILFIFLTHKFQTLESTSLNIALGFITLNICASRHSMFTIFVMAYLLRCLGVSFKSSNVSIAKDIKNSFLFILILGVFYVGLSSFSSFYTMFIEKESNGLSEMCQYISKDYDEDARIFTGFNNGAYFEWKGFKNIYMDARPELYTNDFTGDVDILGDYSKYCIYGYDVTLKSESNEYMFVTKKDMYDWFYSYDFDYVVVTPSVETYLSSYMTCNQAYKRVDGIGSSEYVLYEKIINTRN